MKRRVFTQAFLLGLFCGPAFAADPLPTMQETPMFADQVKSGALPPVDKRIPDSPMDRQAIRRRRRSRPGRAASSTCWWPARAIPA